MFFGAERAGAEHSAVRGPSQVLPGEGEKKDRKDRRCSQRVKGMKVLEAAAGVSCPPTLLGFSDGHTEPRVPCGLLWRSVCDTTLVWETIKYTPQPPPPMTLFSPPPPSSPRLPLPPAWAEGLQNHAYWWHWEEVEAMRRLWTWPQKNILFLEIQFYHHGSPDDKQSSSLETSSHVDEPKCIFVMVPPFIWILLKPHLSNVHLNSQLTASSHLIASPLNRPPPPPFTHPSAEKSYYL